MLEFSDIIIIIIAIISSGIFYFLGTNKLYRFYFGIIMGFLLFLVFSLQVKLFEVSGGITGGWEEYLVLNKDFISGFLLLMIPIFGLLFTLFDSDLKSNKIFSLLFGFLLPLFILGIFGYILLHFSIKLDFLNNIFGFLKNSYIFDILQKEPQITFGLFIIVIFWKFIFAIIIGFLYYLSKLLLNELKELKGDKKNLEEKKSD